MLQNDHAPVERLYLRLSEALQRSRRNPYDAPVTVAEIYQELIPYRLVRAEAGFDMNADYEHALLRLLAGEGERVRLEPPHAAEELQRELKSANPNLSVYRAYAACDAWVSRPQATSLDSTASSGKASSPEAGTSSEKKGASEPLDEAAKEKAGAQGRFALAEEEPGARAAPANAVSPAPRNAGADAAEPPSEPALATESTASGAGVTAQNDTGGGPAAEVRAEAPRVEAARCAYCDSALPPQRTARFCPYCGADLSTRPCASCGEVIEPGWVFCIACGAAMQ